jgi:hypothetical protein
MTDLSEVQKITVENSKAIASLTQAQTDAQVSDVACRHTQDTRFDAVFARFDAMQTAIGEAVVKIGIYVGSDQARTARAERQTKLWIAVVGALGMSLAGWIGVQGKMDRDASATSIERAVASVAGTQDRDNAAAIERSTAATTDRRKIAHDEKQGGSG